MKEAVIVRSDLIELLRTAADEYNVYTPVRNGDRVVLSQLGENDEIVFDYSNFTLSPKSIFFPQKETLYTYEGTHLREVPLPEGKCLVFGVRPCDARAFALLDMVFGEFGGTSDPYYMRRRENTVVIARACIDPEDTCFCTAIGSHPADTRGSDILAFDINDAFLFGAQTAKGEALMGNWRSVFRNATETDRSVRDQVLEKTRQKMVDLDFIEAHEKLKDRFDSPMWVSISEVCLGCGLCTYQCPTCYCFDITDETKGSQGRRVRTWDSCQYKLFTEHASGHNPRPSKTERMRQRILHKFLYTKQNLEEVFCVGCGRCVRHCPVNLDLRETLIKLLESK